MALSGSHLYEPLSGPARYESATHSCKSARKAGGSTHAEIKKEIDRFGHGRGRSVSVVVKV